LGGHDGFRTQPALTDMQQRLRVAADRLYRDLLTAGAGLGSVEEGSLARYLPVVFPGRRALFNRDDELSFFTDRITIVRAADPRSQTALASSQASSDDPIVIAGARPCPATAPCGFKDGLRALIFDAAAAGAGYDTFLVTSTAGNSLGHGPPNLGFSRAYATPSARVLAIEQPGYALDASTRRLIKDDGYKARFPVIDGVGDVRFSYFADPDPASAPRPALGTASCLWTADDPPVPLLAHLGGTALREVTAAQLTDGPVCGLPPNRFDGDLLRVRLVRVQIRVESSEDLATAPASITFDVTPRNMNLGR
jgi:hypothetical protein